jgi:hypothetical protein
MLSEIKAGQKAPNLLRPITGEPLGLLSFYDCILYGLIAQQKLQFADALSIQETLRDEVEQDEWLGKIHGLSLLPAFRNILAALEEKSGKVFLEVVNGRQERNLPGLISRSLSVQEPVLAWQKDHAVVATEAIPVSTNREEYKIVDPLNPEPKTMEAKRFAALPWRPKKVDDRGYMDFDAGYENDGHLVIIKNRLIYV